MADKKTKIKTTSQLREKEIPALKEEIKSLQKAHFGLRMQKASQQLANTNLLLKTRREIARAKTILNEKLPKNQIKGA